MPVEIERLDAAQVEARRVAQAQRAAAALTASSGDAPARLRMLTTHDGSPDGHHIYPYEAGVVYDLETTPPMSAHLARIFLHAGWSTLVDDDDAAEPDEAPDEAPAETPTASASKRRRKVVGPTELKAPEPGAESDMSDDTSAEPA